MQKSLLFVFVGIPAKDSMIDLTDLAKEIENHAKRKDIEINFSLSGKLLTSRFSDVGYYVSYSESNEELLEWFTMVNNFELKIERKPVTSTRLSDRYAKVKKSNGNRYQEIHFTLGEIIVEEMEKCRFTMIYAFQ